MAFAKLMAGTAGRVIRFVAGALLIILGLLVIHGTAGIVLAGIGLVPLLAPSFDVCVFAPLFGGPFKGSDARKLA